MWVKGLKRISPKIKGVVKKQPFTPTHMAKQTNKSGKRSKSNGKRTTPVRQAACVAEVAPQEGPWAGPGKAAVIHLDINVHKRLYVVCRKVDGVTPQPSRLGCAAWR